MFDLRAFLQLNNSGTVLVHFLNDILYHIFLHLTEVRQITCQREQTMNKFMKKKERKYNPGNIKYGFSEDKHFLPNVFCVVNFCQLKALNHRNLK